MRAPSRSTKKTRIHKTHKYMRVSKMRSGEFVIMMYVNAASMDDMAAALHDIDVLSEGKHRVRFHQHTTAVVVTGKSDAESLYRALRKMGYEYIPEPKS